MAGASKTILHLTRKEALALRNIVNRAFARGLTSKFDAPLVAKLIEKLPDPKPKPAFLNETPVSRPFACGECEGDGCAECFED